MDPEIYQIVVNLINIHWSTEAMEPPIYLENNIRPQNANKITSI